MRMIDADALFKCETCHHRHYGKCTTYCDSGESYRPDMHKLEIIEAEPVRHGEWEGNGLPASKLWHCSVCRRLTETAYYCDHCYYSYCPNCGAKMDGKENEHEF